MPANDLTEVLLELRETSGSGNGTRYSMPPELYVRDDMYELEIDKIFSREWICIGRSNELPETGDFRTLDLIGESLILIRDENRRLRVFSNVCRHRLSRLLSGSGRIKRIVCPYHAWTYSLEGQLLSARYMEDGFSTGDICLPELRTEVWEGFLFTTIGDNPPQFAPRLLALSDHLHNYRVADFEPGFQVDEVWDSNWKVLVENFTDAYHLFRVHRKTVEHALPTRLCEMREGGAQFSLFDQYRDAQKRFDDDGEFIADNPDLTESERQKIPLFAVFPSLLVSVSPERLFWVFALPLRKDKISVRWGIDIYPGTVPSGAQRENMLSKLRNSFDEINNEDKSILTWLYQNAKSRYARKGILSVKENSLTNFHRYLATVLLDEIA